MGIEVAPNWNLLETGAGDSKSVINLHSSLRSTSGGLVPFPENLTGWTSMDLVPFIPNQTNGVKGFSGEVSASVLLPVDLACGWHFQDTHTHSSELQERSPTSLWSDSSRSLQLALPWDYPWGRCGVNLCVGQLAARVFQGSSKAQISCRLQTQNLNRMSRPWLLPSAYYYSSNNNVINKNNSTTTTTAKTTTTRNNSQLYIVPSVFHCFFLSMSVTCVSDQCFCCY